MFGEFFNVLKAKGLDVSLSEWLTLMDALDKGLCESSLTQFYYVARMILVKRETEYDKFDMAFEEHFKGIKSDDDISNQLKRWLDKEDMKEFVDEDDKFILNKQLEGKDIDKEQTMKDFKKRLVVGDRKYRDFRDDRILDNRQFQQALRKLRQFSTKLDIPKTELDLDGTIDKTCNNGGYLQIVMQKPRKNSVKLLLLMDSGGTMIPYTHLLSELFQSVHKSNHYKDVKTYFFHNCIYSKLYNTPECENGDWIDTEWMFRNLDSDYKVIIVGDAAMAPEELFATDGNYRGPNGGLSGKDWLLLMKSHYKKIVWLNPKMAPGNAPWREAETAIKEIFPMYKLTVEGLNLAMNKLLYR